MTVHSILHFKYKLIDEDGQEAGLFSSKGTFDGETLTMDGDTLPVEVIIRCDRRFNRVVLSLLQEDGSIAPFMFAVTAGDMKTLMRQLNATSSRRWADLKQKRHDEEGKGVRLSLEVCPYCDSTIDFTGFERSAQLFCNYCDTIVTLDGTRPKKEEEYAICDECGYFSQPKEFSTFYFYFLIFIYGMRSGKMYVCRGCMRSEAWKMFFANLIFILGVPFAIIQLVRAYTGDGGSASESYKGLDAANVAARKGRIPTALEKYLGMIQNLVDSAGIRYNTGMALMATDPEKSQVQLENALVRCSNYSPALQPLAHLYTKNGETEKLKALEKQWGDDEEETGDSGDSPVAEGEV